MLGGRKKFTNMEQSILTFSERMDKHDELRHHIREKSQGFMRGITGDDLAGFFSKEIKGKLASRRHSIVKV